MSRTVVVVLLAAGLISAPLPTLVGQSFAQTPAADTKTDAKKPSSGVAAMRERQKKCGAECKEAKAAGNVEKGIKWPQYWSACNKRLKAAAN